MALIPCPHCGKEISSYAKRCPGCGKDLTPTVETVVDDVVCPECGTHYDINVASCPNCGEPNKQVGTANHSNPAGGATRKMMDGKQIVAEYGSLLYVSADEFDDDVTICCKKALTGTPELDAICEKYRCEGPNVNFWSFDNTRFSIMYSNFELQSLIEHIEPEQLEDMAERISSHCKGMIITIDDGEKIKLMVREKSGEDSDNEVVASFEITQEQFLKCCNAHKLEFRIFKEDAPDPIIIRGSAEDEELLIASIRAIYNITVQEVFPNAKQKLQSLIEKKEAAKKQVEKAKIEAEERAVQSFKNKKTIGIVLIIVGVVCSLLPFAFMHDRSISATFMAIGIVLLFIGGAFAIYGARRESGGSSSEAWSDIANAFNNIKR